MVENFDSIVEAFDEDDFETYKSLVAKLDDINDTEEWGDTVLCAVVRNAIWGIEGKEKFLKHLIENGSEINFEVGNNLDFSPLRYAAQNDDCLGLVKLLVDLGADVNFNSDDTVAPIFGAINTDQVDIASYFLSLPSFDSSIKATEYTLAQFAKKKNAKQCQALFKEKGIK